MKNLTRACAIILLITGHAHAGLSLVVPFYTTHIEYEDAPCGVEECNESNPGIGFEYKHHSHIMGVTHITRDSFNNPNTYFYYANRFLANKNTSLTVGVFYSTGYKPPAPSVVPIITLSWRNLRVVTSYPVGHIIGTKADIVNLQFVLPIKF